MEKTFEKFEKLPLWAQLYVIIESSPELQRWKKRLSEK